MDREIIIKVENLVKEYRLGSIGGRTLNSEIQSFLARMFGKDDPNSKVGSRKVSATNELFRALDDISFEVKKGEAIGIIGHNGAGKSTLLKLLSRVTAPTSGKISYNGRIASMLEVGTGFHPELTGRENIYMNGAILGMTKAEIDRKFDEIVDFAEMRRFIDTPVKRYSSGMYVKLAFAVAAHLDSEILVMDEVLAVGDMKFQQKCLGKMGDAASHDGKTVLYVSHNMNTIRTLCTRCLVLQKGKIIFDGDTEKAIELYTDNGMLEKFTQKDLRDAPRYVAVDAGRKASFTHVQILENGNNIFQSRDILKLRLCWSAEIAIEKTSLRLVFESINGYPVASSVCLDFCYSKIGNNIYDLELPLNQLMEGIYEVTLVLLEKNDYGTSTEIDVIKNSFALEISVNNDFLWSPSQWGAIRLLDIKATRVE